MAEALLAGAAVGAVASALLDEVMRAAKTAIRCKENCDNLLRTLKSVEPLLKRVTESCKASENDTCKAWLADLHDLLLKAEGIIGKCTVKKSRFHVVYVKKWHLSSSIEGIERQIKEKLPEANLLTLDIVQVVYQIMTGQSTASPRVDRWTGFETQPVPGNIVTFERNPFKKLKELILAVADAARSDPMTVGLKGRGGAGKTLLAKMVNNDEDIRDKYGAGSMLWITIGNDASIQSAYSRMEEFLKDSGVFVRDFGHRSLEDQRAWLAEAFRRKRMLLILDDVWENSYNSRAVVDWLDICKGSGSTTLITTRNESVLARTKAKERVEVQSLSEEESWKLFCYHAFQTGIPPSGQLLKTAGEICGECKGLPLALEVIGSCMWGKKESEWNYALTRLRRAESMCNSKPVDDELFHRLKFSYEELQEDTKKCFLYFAALPEDYAISTDRLCAIWQAEELFGHRDAEDAMGMGLTNLVALADRCLIDLDEDVRSARVHDVLRDLAIRIIREAKAGEWASECHFEPGKVLEKFPALKGTTKRASLMASRLERSESRSSLLVPELRVCLLSELSAATGGSENVRAQLERFVLRMPKLSYLDLSGCRFLEELPDSWKHLKCLTHLDLSRCSSLKALPESIGELKSLMHMDLSGCWSLKALPESIGELKSVTHLNLRECMSLKALAESIGELKSLMHMDLRGCSSLEALPESIGELKCLTHLDLRECWSLKELPVSIGELKSLTHLRLKGCSFLKALPESIGELKSLMHMDLSGCWSLKELPKSIEELKFLTHLNMRECTSLEALLESIGELKSLMHLNLSWCKSLEKLPENIKDLKSLTHLDLSCCRPLEALPESIGKLKSLTHLDLRECWSLKALPESIGELKSLTHLDLRGCRSLQILLGVIKDLKSLTHLDLRECTSLKALPESIGELKSLTHLNLSWCKSLEELPESIRELKSLTHLDLSWCSSLKALPESIKELKFPMHLGLFGCWSLKELPKSIKELKSLTHLDLSECNSLEELPESINELESLTHLNVRACESLKALPESIKELKFLIHFNLSGCRSLKALPESIGELKSLTHLDLSWCSSLKALPKSIGDLKSLMHLDLSWCRSLEALPESIKELKFLTHLDVKECESLKALPESMKELKSLRHFNLS